MNNLENFEYKVEENADSIIISKYKNKTKIIEKSFNKKDFSYDWEISVEENLRNFRKMERCLGHLIFKSNLLLFTRYLCWAFVEEKESKKIVDNIGNFDNLSEMLEELKKHMDSNESLKYNYYIGINGRVRKIQKEILEKIK